MLYLHVLQGQLCVKLQSRVVWEEMAVKFSIPMLLPRIYTYLGPPCLVLIHGVRPPPRHSIPPKAAWTIAVTAVAVPNKAMLPQ